MENLLNQLSPKLQAKLKDFDVMSVWIEQNEVNVRSNWDLPQDFIEAIEKELKSIVKKVMIKIDNSRIMDSIETAHLKITSPTGTTIYLYKTKLNKATKEQRDIFWKFCKDPMFRFIGEMEATKEEMNTLLQISKL